MINRETIWQGVFAFLQNLAPFLETGRTVKHWDNCDNFPALFMEQGAETVTKTGRGLPQSYTMTADIYLYVRNESNGTPAPQVNALLDAVDAALKPTTPDGRVTLGGLVHDAWIEGQIARDEGVLGQIGVAVVPLKILLAQ
jgi:hypothetical protein